MRRWRIGLLAGVLAAARLRASSGYVFEDLNHNGVRDPGEPGVAAEVSNGVEVIRTDDQGHYQLPDRPGGVFLIKPRGYQSPVDLQELPRFHARGAADFPLHRVDEPNELRALILTDPQPATLTEVGYLERGFVGHLGKRPDLAFGVTLGDVVYDRPDLFGAVNAALAGVGIPWYSLPGNHDLLLADPDEGAAVAGFEAAYGPSTYAFHAGPALFVALDDVRPLGGPRYVGGLRDEQFQFLANLLRSTPAAEWVVLMFHIPLFSPDPSGTEGFRKADRLRLFGLLQGRPHLLILSGHTHYQRHVLHGPDDGWHAQAALPEYNVAAACGGFWGGPRDAEGIPVATMWDGTPPGYAVLSFRGDTVALDYFPQRLPAAHQLSVHAPRALAPRQGYVSFYANVFNGDDRWTVEARVDDRAWNPIRRLLGWDPSYAADFLAQDSVDRPAPGPRLPDPVVCYHLWRGTLPADLALGPHVLHIRATDPLGRVFTTDQPLQIAAP